MANFNIIQVANNEKLTLPQLKQAILQTIADEYEAASRYRQIADNTTDENVKKVMNSVADEEMVHAGEFQALFESLFSNETELLTKGENEAKVLIGEQVNVAEEVASQVIEKEATEKVGDENETKKKRKIVIVKAGK